MDGWLYMYVTGFSPVSCSKCCKCIRFKKRDIVSGVLRVGCRYYMSSAICLEVQADMHPGPVEHRIHTETHPAIPAICEMPEQFMRRGYQS